MIGETSIGKLIDRSTVTGDLRESGGMIYRSQRDGSSALWHEQMEYYLRTPDTQTVSMIAR